MKKLGLAHMTLGAVLVVAAVVVQMQLLDVSSGTAAAASTADCSTYTSEIQSGCTPYFISSSASATPDQAKCCSPLRTVLASSDTASCLCSFLASSGSVSPVLTQRAYALPKACNISTTFGPSSCSSNTSTSSSPSSSSPTHTTTGSPLNHSTAPPALASIASSFLALCGVFFLFISS